MNPLPLDQLREKARAAGSVNVDRATYYSLRWHDPAFNASLDRFNKANREWDADWAYNIGRSEPVDRYWPDVTKLHDPARIKLCEEFVAAREAHFKIRTHFLETTLETT